MVYQGSKNKLAKYLKPIIESYIQENNITDYYELFVGGANLIDKIDCENKHGYDSNDYLISLLKYAQSDPELSIAPLDCSFEHYKDVRTAYNNKDYSTYSKEYIALIGYMASYGGRFYDGGFGRKHQDGKSVYQERVINLKTQAPDLDGIDFQYYPFELINPDGYENCLFYLDPPYRDTKFYGKEKLNYEYFYKFCKKLAKKNIVLISEFYMPDEFECIWEKERAMSLGSTGIRKTEKLFKA